MGCTINLCPSYYREYNLGSPSKCLMKILHITPIQLGQLWRRICLLDMLVVILCMWPYLVLHASTNSFLPTPYIGNKTFPWKNGKVYKIKFHQTPYKEIILDDEMFLYDLSEELCGISYTENLHISWYKDYQPAMDFAHKVYVVACTANVLAILSAIICKSNIYWIEIVRLGWVTTCQICATVLGVWAAILLRNINLCIFNITARGAMHTLVCFMLFLQFVFMMIIVIPFTLWVWWTERKKRKMWLKFKLDCLSEFQKIDKIYYSKQVYETLFPGGTSWGPEFMITGGYFNIHLARFLGRLPPARTRTRKENKTVLQELFNALYPKPKLFFKSHWVPNEHQKQLHAGYWPNPKYLKHHLLSKLEEDQNEKSGKKSKKKDGNKNPEKKIKIRKTRTRGHFEKRVTILEPSRDEQHKSINNEETLNENLMSEGEQSLLDLADGEYKENPERRKSTALRTMVVHDLGQNSPTAKPEEPRKAELRRKRKGNNTSVKIKKQPQGCTTFGGKLCAFLCTVLKICFGCRIFNSKIINRWKRKLYRKFLKLFTWSRFVHFRFQWFYPGAKRRHLWGRRPRDMFFKNIKIINGKIVPIVDYHLWGKRPKGLWESIPKKRAKHSKKLPGEKNIKLIKETQVKGNNETPDIDRNQLKESESKETVTILPPHYSKHETNKVRRKGTIEDFNSSMKIPTKSGANGQKRDQMLKEEKSRRYEFMMRNKILEPVERFPNESDNSYQRRAYLWHKEALRLRVEQRRRRRRRLRRYIRTRFKKRRLKDGCRNLYISPFIQVYHAPPEVFIEKNRLAELRSEMLELQDQESQSEAISSEATVQIPELGETELQIPTYDLRAVKNQRFKNKINLRPGYTYIPSRRVGRDGQWVPDINLDAVRRMKPRTIPIPTKWQPKLWALPRITLQRPSDEFGNLPPLEVLFDPITHPHIDLTHTELKVVFHVENNPANYFRTYKGDLDREIYVKKKRLLITEERDYVFYKQFLKKSKRWHKTPDKYRKQYPGAYWDRIIYDQTGDVPNNLYWSKKLGRKLSKLWDLRWGTPVSKFNNNISNDHHTKKLQKIVLDKEKEQVRVSASRKAVNLFQHQLFNTPMDPSERQAVRQRAPSIVRPKGRVFKKHTDNSKKRQNRVKKRFRKPLRPYFAMPIDLPPGLLNEPDPFPPYKGLQPTQSEMTIGQPMISGQQRLSGQQILPGRFKNMPEHLRLKLRKAKINLLKKKHAAIMKSNSASSSNIMSSRTNLSSYGSHLSIPGSRQSQVNFYQHQGSNLSIHGRSSPKQKNSLGTGVKLASMMPSLSAGHLRKKLREHQKSVIELKNRSKSQNFFFTKPGAPEVRKQSSNIIKPPLWQPKRHTRHDIHQHINTSDSETQFNPGGGVGMMDNDASNALTIPEFVSSPPKELYRDLNFTRFKAEKNEKRMSTAFKAETGATIPQPRSMAENEGKLFYTKKRRGIEKKISPKDAEKEKISLKKSPKVPISIVDNYRADRLKTIMIKEARRIFVHKLINFRRRFLTEQKIELIKMGYELPTILEWQKEYYDDKSKLPGQLHGYKFKYATFN